MGLIVHFPDVRGWDVVPARHSILNIEQVAHLVFPVPVLHDPDPG